MPFALSIYVSQLLSRSNQPIKLNSQWSLFIRLIMHTYLLIMNPFQTLWSFIFFYLTKQCPVLWICVLPHSSRTSRLILSLSDYLDGNSVYLLHVFAWVLSWFFGFLPKSVENAKWLKWYLEKNERMNEWMSCILQCLPSTHSWFSLCKMCGFHYWTLGEIKINK